MVINKLKYNKSNIFCYPYGKVNEKVYTYVKKIYDKKKIIAAICSGTMMLISANILKNKKVTGYYAWKQDIINAGGIFVDLFKDFKIMLAP